MVGIEASLAARCHFCDAVDVDTRRDTHASAPEQEHRCTITSRYSTRSRRVGT